MRMGWMKDMSRIMDTRKLSFASLLCWILLLFNLIQQTACAASQPHVEPSREVSRQTESGRVRAREKSLRRKPTTSRRRREPEDEENTWTNRLLAAPEYAWAGIAYPFKKFAIAYEEHDLLNRALDVFLTDERTAGVYPKFAIGGALSGGVGFTAFDNNLFHQNKEARLSYLVATRENQVGEASYRDPTLFGSQWSLDSNAFWLNFDESHFSRVATGRQSRMRRISSSSSSPGM